MSRNCFKGPWDVVFLNISLSLNEHKLQLGVGSMKKCGVIINNIDFLRSPLSFQEMSPVSIMLHSTQGKCVIPNLQPVKAKRWFPLGTPEEF